MHSNAEEETSYWLLNWLGSKRIRSISEAGVALSRKSTLRELRAAAEQWSESVPFPPDSLNLVAGSGLNFSDDLTCPNPICRHQQVDLLFRHAWHYFDKILLPDRVGGLLLNPPENWPVKYRNESLLNAIEIVLHIQELGASSLVSYYPVNGKLRDAIDNDELDEPRHWEGAWEDVEGTMLEKAKFIIKSESKGKFLVNVSDPFLQVTNGVDIQLEKNDPSDEDSLRRFAAHRLTHRHMGPLAQDIRTAHDLKGSLASTVWSHEQALIYMSKAPDPSSVAFHISFPTLENVPINELIEIRSANGDAFLSFRNSLTKAAREMSANYKSLGYEELARQIKSEIIDDEIAKLNKRLRTAKSALTRKVITAITLSSVGTLCAAFFGLFPAIATGTIATGAAIANINKDASKYIDDKREIELSDMYFVWKALNHAK